MNGCKTQNVAVKPSVEWFVDKFTVGAAFQTQKLRTGEEESQKRFGKGLVRAVPVSTLEQEEIQ